MLNTDFFKELDRFCFMVKKRVTTVYAGERRSIRQGKGSEIVDYREYMPGDDFKSVDWKLYGRTEKLYIRRFEEEKNLTTHILIDASKSMDFGAVRKFDYASMIGAGFAYLVTNENERFALSLFADQLVEVMEPRRGKRHFLAAIDLLNKAPAAGTTRLDLCSEQYSKMIKSRSLVVLISDFMQPLPSIEEGLYKISRGSHDLIVVQVLDLKEKDLGWAEGDTKLYDLETGEMVHVYISPRFRELYRERFEAHSNGIRKACEEVGADFFSITSNTPIFDAFLAIVG
ncbi:MAG: DUF58 domain-containing protein [Euryarchaeota archaeon]|nr:DUF58 domain-containing protein [Euryarchaeota archaeon]